MRKSTSGKERHREPLSPMSGGESGLCSDIRNLKPEA